jgi:hypothetical protein
MAFAILAIIVTWFAIRRGQAWGLWAVSAAALVQVPYYAVITSIYAAQGAPLGGTVSLFPFVVGHSSRSPSVWSECDGCAGQDRFAHSEYATTRNDTP